MDIFSRGSLYFSRELLPFTPVMPPRSSFPPPRSGGMIYTPKTACLVPLGKKVHCRSYAIHISEASRKTDERFKASFHVIIAPSQHNLMFLNSSKKCASSAYHFADVLSNFSPLYQ